MSYTKLIIWQYRNKPKACATIKVFSDLFNEIQSVARGFPKLFDIETAQGYHLDVIGEIVGISRIVRGFVYKEHFAFIQCSQALGFSISGVGGGRWYRYLDPVTNPVYLLDEDYRWLIKAKIFKNNQKGNLGYLIYVLKELIGEDINVTDNYDMTVSIDIDDYQLTDFMRYAIINLDILPRPQAVQYNIRMFEFDKTYFGFKGFKQAEAFGKGEFLRNYNIKNY